MASYTQTAFQQLSSLNEQNLTIETCVKTFSLYVNVLAKLNELNVLGFEGLREVGILMPCFVFLYTVSEKDYFSRWQQRWQEELSKLEESIDTNFFLSKENNLSLNKIYESDILLIKIYSIKLEVLTSLNFLS